MKRLVFVFVFLFFLTDVSSSNVGIGKVHLYVTNKPPIVTNVVIFPAAYENTVLNCEADFEDELENINLSYKWYSNNFLVYDQGNALPPSYFDKGDIVTCEVIPHDFVQYGEAKIISIEIKSKPFLTSITGAVVGVGKQTGILNTFLILVLIALVILSISYFLRK